MSLLQERLESLMIIRVFSIEDQTCQEYGTAQGSTHPKESFFQCVQFGLRSDRGQRLYVRYSILRLQHPGGHAVLWYVYRCLAADWVAPAVLREYQRDCSQILHHACQRRTSDRGGGISGRWQ